MMAVFMMVLGAASFSLSATVKIPDAVASVSAGSRYTCAVTQNGSAWCWGDNTFGQLGNSSRADSNVPVRVKGLARVSAISAGSEHACAVTENGEAFCWGEGSLGRLGTGTTDSSLEPRKVQGLPAVQSIAAGDKHSCAVSFAGEGYCWGDNGAGQLGTGSQKSSLAPVKIAVLRGIERVSLSLFYDTSCARTSRGFVHCWGDNRSGQLGIGDRSRFNFTPRQVLTLGESRDFSAKGSGTVCAASAAMEAWCWGSNWLGALGTGGETGHGTGVVEPTKVATDNDIVAIATGSVHTCAVDASRHLYCWGANLSGSVGNGKTTQQARPQKIDLAFPVHFLSAGYNHTCAADKIGQVFCWGAGEDGQLGHGAYIKEQLVPVKVAFPEQARKDQQ